MNIIRLEGKTQKGKNRIRELGDEWIAVKQQNTVSFSNDFGPWVLIHPIDNIDKPRWIKQDNDPDFQINAWL